MRRPTPPLIQDDLLSVLYQNLLEPLPFVSFLQKLSTHLGIPSAAIDIGTGVDDIPPVGIDSAWHALSNTEKKRLAELTSRYWKLYPRRQPLIPGDIYYLDQVDGYDRWNTNTDAQQGMALLGRVHELVMVLAGPDNIVCLLRLSAGKNEVLDDTRRSFLQSLRSHLERALEMHMRIHRPVSIITMFNAMLDRLGIGHFLLNGRGRILQNNQAAEHLLDIHPCLSVHDQLVSLSGNSEQNKALKALIQKAIVWRENVFGKHYLENVATLQQSLSGTGENNAGGVLRVEDPQGGHLDILVQAIRPFYAYRNETAAQVSVCVVDSQRTLSAPKHLIKQLYGLTLSEAEFALLLANGYSIQDAAAKLGWTLGSGRTYSKTIYAKTGVSGQAELAQLLLKSIALLSDIDPGDRGNGQ